MGVASIYSKGEKLEISFTGTVTTGLHDYDHHSCIQVQDSMGYTHFVYLPSDGVTTKPVENFTAGDVYKSAIGYTYLRTTDGKWIELTAYGPGAEHVDTYPTRPLTKLAV